MQSREIRSKFLDFFQNKSHQIVASAPVVQKNDPTLMFVNAGMNPFKSYFLGETKAPHNRVANTQKCLRVSGKHNDLDEVGHDTYHHTLFEMLGNWSFGDYFKEEAIEWAWEFLTKELKINPELLYVTIFSGDKKDGLEKDTEAQKIWEKYIPSKRILAFDKKDNFWEMGDQGPCGPCSEIHIDLRAEEDKKEIPGKDLVNMDHPQVIEIWNLVFMQFLRKADSSLEELPVKHIDTGMGFERLARVIQGKNSNYDSDVFMPIIQKIEEITDLKYGVNEENDIAIRVIADHVRAAVFTIADGQIPSNTGAGYVIRRIIRRAVRYAYTFLDVTEPILEKLVEVLSNQMGAFFPELKNIEFIRNIIKEEEESFLKTLQKGIQLLNQNLNKIDSSNKIFDGKIAFQLYDTYGFPIDLTEVILREKGISVDLITYEKELEKQKKRSKQDSEEEKSDWIDLSSDNKTKFLGYDKLHSKSKILRYRKITSKGKDKFQLVFSSSPFYPRGGGQIGDTGILKQKEETITILDTFKENDAIIHEVKKLPTEITKDIELFVDEVKRSSTSLNHTATHLMHYALREILGKHVEQRGSLVHPNYLRFDFSHSKKMTAEEIEAVEIEVNKQILQNLALEEFRNIPIEEAKKMGAMALFGEKYGDEVRAIKFGNSIELCGGTHVSHTGKILGFKIISEGSVASGIRRIEAITGSALLGFYHKKEKELNKIERLLKSSDTLSSIQKLMDENQKLKESLAVYEKQAVKSFKTELINNSEKLGDIEIISGLTHFNASLIKDLTFELVNEIPNSILIIGSETEGKALLTLNIHKNLVNSKNLNASKLIREGAKFIQGGGGGQPFFATAGGKNPAGLNEAMEVIKNYCS